jgi:hypothetical protein
MVLVYSSIWIYEDAKKFTLLSKNRTGIISIIDRIPDEDVRKIQTYLQQCTADD